MRIIGIIPARGGSKGIPRKNLKEIAGKPLIAWTIMAAKNSELLDDFFVSTEDEEIAYVSRWNGAPVIDRPSELAGDDVSVLSVLSHAAKETKADYVVLLQPTSPIRDHGLIDDCIREFLGKKADSLATGFICNYKPYGTEKAPTRQLIKGFFYDDGNVYVLKSGLVHRGLKIGHKAVKKIISKEQNLEIDDETDFFIAEKVLEKRMKE